MLAHFFLTSAHASIIVLLVIPWMMLGPRRCRLILFNMNFGKIRGQLCSYAHTCSSWLIMCLCQLVSQRNLSCGFACKGSQEKAFRIEFNMNFGKIRGQLCSYAHTCSSWLIMCLCQLVSQRNLSCGFACKGSQEKAFRIEFNMNFGKIRGQLCSYAHTCSSWLIMCLCQLVSQRTASLAKAPKRRRLE